MQRLHRTQRHAHPYRSWIQLIAALTFSGLTVIFAVAENGQLFNCNGECINATVMRERGLTTGGGPGKGVCGPCMACRVGDSLGGDGGGDQKTFDVDLFAEAAGVDFAQERADSSIVDFGGTNGGQYVPVEDARVIESGNPGSITVTLAVTDAKTLTFSPNGSGGWNIPADSTATLVQDNANLEYRMTNDVTGEVFKFHSYANSVPLKRRGKLKEKTTRRLMAKSKPGCVVTRHATGTNEGRVDFVTLPVMRPGSTQTHVFSYVRDGDDIKQVNLAQGSDPIGVVDYSYHTGTGHANVGRIGDLLQVKIGKAVWKRDITSGSPVQDWSRRVTQYRWTLGTGGSKLKAVYRPEDLVDIHKLNSTLLIGMQNTLDLIIKPDNEPVVTGRTLIDMAGKFVTYYTANVSTAPIQTAFASENLESTYGGTGLNENGLVKEARTRGGASSSGGCCGGGSSGSTLVRKFYYVANGDPQATKLVVTDLVDSSGPVSREIGALNERGYMLRHAFIQDPISTTPKYWCDSWILNSADYILEHRLPSAHLVTNQSQLQAFFDPNNNGNDASTLSTTAGRIDVFEYDTANRQTGVRVKNVSSGASNYIAATDYNADQLVTATYTYPTATTDRGQGKKVDYAYTYWNSDPKRVMKATITSPIVPTTQNGSGVAIVEEKYYDELGQLRWEKNGEGYVNYYSYDIDNGELAYTIVDAHPNSLPPSATASNNSWLSNQEYSIISGTTINAPTRSGSAPATQLVSSVEFDELDRPYKQIKPGGSADYTFHFGEQSIRIRSWSGTSTPVPIDVVETDQADRVVKTYGVIPTQAEQTGGIPDGLKSDTNQAHYTSYVRNDYDHKTGNLLQANRYFKIPASGDGGLNTDFHRTAFVYDSAGRRKAVVEVVSGVGTGDGVEQVTETVYDLLGRVVQTKRGVSDAFHDMTVSYSSLPTANMRVVARTVYDGGGVGDSLVTASLSYFGPNDTDNTGKMYYRTFRGDIRGIVSISAYNSTTFAATRHTPCIVIDPDWMGRTIAEADYSTEPTWSLFASGFSKYASDVPTDRNQWSQSYFDNMGRGYREEKYNGTLPKFQSDRYFDRNSQLVATAEKNGALVEYAYDGAGRRYQSRTVFDDVKAYASGTFSYHLPTPAPTLSITGGNEKVLEIQHSDFDSSGNTIGQHTLELNHNDTDGIGPSDYVRRTVYSWFDDADRVTEVADFGSGNVSGGGSWMFTSFFGRPSKPTVSTTALLLTKYSYDSAGQLESMTDPKGKVTKHFYDALGRTTNVSDNHDNFSPPATNLDDAVKDNVVATMYNGLDQVTKFIAKDKDGNGNDTDDEVTDYLYRDPQNARLVTHVIHPDATNRSSDDTPTSDQVKILYNLDGSIKERTDQRGVRMTYTYGAYATGRRLTWEKAESIPSPVDTAIQAIERTYDSSRQNRVTRIRSYATPTGGTIQNDVELAYDTFTGQLTYGYQSHQGAKTGTTPYVLASFDTSVDANNTYDDGYRQYRLRYPSGKNVDTDFVGVINDRLHRGDRFKSDIEGVVKDIASYKFNGTGRVVETTYNAPAVHSKLFGGTNQAVFDRLDRFGRIVTKNWGVGTDPLTVVTRDQFGYTYDFASNRLTRNSNNNNNSGTAHDQTYTYDGLHRIASLVEAGLSQSWNLDSWGNWGTFTQDGTSQVRTHNVANETTAIAGSSTFVSHDAAGNMTKIPKPASWAAGFDLTYDAWNRLVKVMDGGTTVATYEYDGLHRRIQKVAGANTFDYYYNHDWQVVEIRKNGSSSPLEQYTWHPYYIDAMASRYWDGNANNSYADANEVHFAMHDANFNVTGLVNSTGTVFERYHYSPYGQLTVLNGDYSPDSMGGDGLSDVANPFTYTGRELDAETGLYQYRNRYYHAQLGRFVTRDPISAVNLHEFEDGDPVSNTDPLGLQTRRKGRPRPTASPPIPSHQPPGEEDDWHFIGPIDRKKNQRCDVFIYIQTNWNSTAREQEVLLRAVVNAMRVSGKNCMLCFRFVEVTNRQMDGRTGAWDEYFGRRESGYWILGIRDQGKNSSPHYGWGGIDRAYCQNVGMSHPLRSAAEGVGSAAAHELFFHGVLGEIDISGKWPDGLESTKSGQIGASFTVETAVKLIERLCGNKTLNGTKGNLVK